MKNITFIPAKRGYTALDANSGEHSKLIGFLVFFDKNKSIAFEAVTRNDLVYGGICDEEMGYVRNIKEESSLLSRLKKRLKEILKIHSNNNQQQDGKK